MLENKIQAGIDMSVQAEMARLTLIVKTMLRFDSIRLLLSSVQKHRQLRWCPIIVVDDSPDIGGYCRDKVKRELEQEFNDLQLNYHLSSIDIGLAKGRNIALSLIETPYFLLLDDDLIIPYETNFYAVFKKMRENAAIDYLGFVYKERYDIAIPGQKLLVRALNRFFSKIKLYGLLRKLSRLRLNLKAFTRISSYTGSNELQADGFWLLKVYDSGYPNWQSCQLIHNFFMAQTRRVRENNPWDANFRLQEHEIYFLTAARLGMGIFFCSDIWAYHTNARPKAYKKFRDSKTRTFGQGSELRAYLKQKYAVRKMRTEHYTRYGDEEPRYSVEIDLT